MGPRPAPVNSVNACGPPADGFYFRSYCGILHNAKISRYIILSEAIGCGSYIYVVVTNDVC